MSPFDVLPAYRGRTYIDTLQMVDDTSGEPLPFDPSDVLTWCLSPLDGSASSRNGLDAGWDYGFRGPGGPGLWCSRVAVVTLTLGSGLILSTDGIVQWTLNEGQTSSLCRSRYRMTLDLYRSGETAPVLDTTLTVMD